MQGQRPLRELVKSTSKREAFESTYRRYNYTLDAEGNRVQRIGLAQVAVVPPAERRLSPQPITGRRTAAVAAAASPRLKGKDAFGNLQTGF